jgi:hypothetical protein
MPTESRFASRLNQSFATQSGQKQKSSERTNVVRSAPTRDIAATTSVQAREPALSAYEPGTIVIETAATPLSRAQHRPGEQLPGRRGQSPASNGPARPLSAANSSSRSVGATSREGGQARHPRCYSGGQPRQSDGRRGWPNARGDWPKKVNPLTIQTKHPLGIGTEHRTCC